ncbi:MAG: NADH-quinone oxidoreductase subunit C [Candidatus Thermoplasmatota archaeon]|nr:NADH-quinone oxidoreductase subunit C [Candidatus Thermoplasmatota archaeon]WMT45018.1 MAG: NADH-quinone oxidoreductase subunit C [Cuniculiplasma divulgatum]
MVEIIEETRGKDGRRNLKVAKENLVELIKDLKSKGYDHLSLITGIDRKDRLEVVYHLHNMKENEYVVVRTETTDERMPSISSLYASANWEEREQYDMLGIVFEGHPNLKRLFLPESWVGHPLRKNYDLSKVQYINMDEDGNDYATFDPGDGW